MPPTFMALAGAVSAREPSKAAVGPRSARMVLTAMAPTVALGVALQPSAVARGSVRAARLVAIDRRGRGAAVRPRQRQSTPRRRGPVAGIIGISVRAITRLGRRSPIFHRWFA